MTYVLQTEESDACKYKPVHQILQACKALEQFFQEGILKGYRQMENGMEINMDLSKAD